ncbi:MAG: LamG-like jellyroll fold domain-containing protein [Verrucomicrobiota bacterium]
MLQTALAVGGLLAASGAAQAALVGQWDFENGNLVATSGKDLTYAGFAVQGGTQFGTTTALGIPGPGGQEAKVMKFPATNPGEGYAIPTPASGNGGGSLVNQWTLFMDVLFPAESNNKWRGLLEIDGGTINPDGELFVNNGNGIGISGAYSGVIQPNTWHRVAFVIDQSEGVNVIRKYIDGVEVGVQNAGGIDGRWAFSPNSTSILFSDDDNEVATGFVNSIQLYDNALSKAQITAFGSATAAGLPATLPTITAFVERWIPAGANAKAGTEVGVVLNTGKVNVTGLGLRLNGTAVTPAITTAGALLTAKVPGAVTNPRTDHELILTYTDSAAGFRSFTNKFRIPLVYEDFEGLVLGPNVDEATAGEKVFTKDPPAGWIVDQSQMPTNTITGQSWADDGIGVTEFKGWTFLNRDWWVRTAGDQTRSQFTLASGTVAVADPDEWDDKGNPDGTIGYFTSFLTTQEISLAGVAANSMVLKFVSSWRPEGKDDARYNPDDGTPGGGPSDNNQTAIVRVSFDGGAPIEVIKWDSVDGSPTFKPDSQNESVERTIANPAGAQKMKITFGLLNAGNDWWWAVDNIVVDAGSLPPPTITGQPADASVVAGQNVSFTGAASGAGLSYQWFAGDTAIPSATNASLALVKVQASQAGGYKLVVSNSGGSVTSRVAQLAVLPALTDNSVLKNGLKVYLPFDNNYNDASGNGLNGAAVGSPTFVAGAVGSGAVQVLTDNAAGKFDYVTLGNQIDFGTTTDFSVSLWVKFTSLSGDPALISNKDWDSGSNPGFVLFTTSGRRARWNYRSSSSARVDCNVPPEAFPGNNWGHMLVTYNRDGSAHTYVNGNLIDVRSLGTPGTLFQADGMALNIGQDGAGNYSSNQNAAYDEVAIWTRALNEQEAAAVFQAGANGRSFLASAPPSDVVLSAQLSNGELVVTWTGGNAPFVVQTSATLGGAWSSQTTSERTVRIPATGAATFVRVQQAP